MPEWFGFICAGLALGAVYALSQIVDRLAQLNDLLRQIRNRLPSDEN
jgi:hypothetical protein